MVGSDEETGHPTATAPFAAATAQQAPQASVSTGGGTSDGYGRDRDPPPGYDGLNPEVTFRLFEKNLRLWQFETDVPQRKQGAKLLRVLTGTARMAVEELEYEQIASEDGLKNIVNCLRDYYNPHLEVSLPRAFESAVYGAPRGGKESFSEYVHRMERGFTLLAKEGVTLPSGAVGYIIFRQSSLNEAQEQRVQTWCEGKYDREPIIKALRRLDKVVKEKGNKNSYAVEVENASTSEHVYVGENEVEGEVSDGDHIFIAEGDLDVIYEEPEMLEALASYQEVRQALKDQRTNRGYFPGKGGGGYGKGKGKGKFKVHREQLKLRTRCWRCQQIGHISAECTNKPVPKDASSGASRSSHSNSSSGNSSKSGFFVSTAEDSFVGVVFGGDQSNSTDFWLRQFVEDRRSREICDGAQSSESYKERTVGMVGEGGFCGIVTSSFEGVVDTAAEGGLIGSFALKRLEDELLKHGLRCCWIPKTSSAKGVGGNAMVCGVVLIPLGIGKINGVLEATVVDGDVPLLLPIKLLKTLQAVVNLPKMQLQLELHGKTIHMREMSSGHCVINITEFSDGPFETPHGMDYSFVLDTENGGVSAMLAHPRVEQFDRPTQSLREPSVTCTHGVADGSFAGSGSTQANYAASSSCGAGCQEDRQFPTSGKSLEGVARQDDHFDAVGGTSRRNWRLVPTVVGAGIVALVRSYGGGHLCSDDFGGSSVEAFAVQEPSINRSKCMPTPQESTQGWRQPGSVVHRLPSLQFPVGDAIPSQGGSGRSETTEGPLESNAEELASAERTNGCGAWNGAAVGDAECPVAGVGDAECQPGCVGEAECQQASCNLHGADEKSHRSEDPRDVGESHAESGSIFAAGLSTHGNEWTRDAEDVERSEREGDQTRSSISGHDEENPELSTTEPRSNVRGEHAFDNSCCPSELGDAGWRKQTDLQVQPSCGTVGGQEEWPEAGQNMLEGCSTSMRLLPVGQIPMGVSPNIPPLPGRAKSPKRAATELGSWSQVTHANMVNLVSEDEPEL